MCCWDAPDPVNKKPWTLQIPSTLPLHIPSTTPKQGSPILSVLILKPQEQLIGEYLQKISKNSFFVALIFWGTAGTAGHKYDAAQYVKNV